MDEQESDAGPQAGRRAHSSRFHFLDASAFFGQIDSLRNRALIDPEQPTPANRRGFPAHGRSIDVLISAPVETARMQSAADSIICDLEVAVACGSDLKRIYALRSVTDLFFQESVRFSEEQMRVFDHVLCILVQRVETRARAELSRRLAPIDHAPVELMQQLARDDEIAAAGDVLSYSTRLTTRDLVEIAESKSQAHLLAISDRANLAESVTDVIVDRGEARVLRKLASNASARFSEAGYSGIISKAEADDGLAEAIGLRIGLPHKVLLELLERTTQAVRARLVAVASPELRDEIKRILNAVSGMRVQDKAVNQD